MVSLDSIRENILKIIQVLPVSLHTEAAIFDRSYQLLACTPAYLKHKGHHVHAPSLEDVFNHGTVVVNNPGHMPSCAGCRFKDDCPATVEILSPINANNECLGVISLTSFTTEGQKRIMHNAALYQDTLAEISDLVATMAVQKSFRTDFPGATDPLRDITDLSDDYFFLIDRQGMIAHYNAAAFRLFPQCSVSSDFLGRLLPQKVLADILAGQRLIGKHIQSASLTATLTSIPIMNNSNFVGAIIQINHNTGVQFNQTRLIDKRPGDALGNIKGSCDAIETLKTKVKKIASSRSTVLITGETGTGKELLAKAIHDCSNRAAGPFISINCASIPDNLLESELFGYDEGAFTGAKKGGKPGRFELANGGTIYLDEIGEMPPPMQAKLLRALQDRTVVRVGGVRPVPFDARIIAATNQNPAELIQKGRFRADLFYRLNVIPLNISPLRVRGAEDIEILAEHFLRKHSKRIRGFAADVLPRLTTYSWPGNVRELENAIEYAVNMEELDLLTCGSLPDNLLKNRPAEEPEMRARIHDTEAATINEALNKYGWDVAGKTRAAKELGIGLRTLYRKLKELN